MICTDCEGSGKTGPVHLNFGDGRGEWRDHIACRRCKGSGQMPDHMLDWIKRGRAHRDTRLSRCLSLRERARELGLSPSEVSAMERGMCDPAPLGQ